MRFNIIHSYDMETGQYIVEIPEFNLVDYWDTIDEAENNLKGALSLYLEEFTENKKLNSKELEYA
jgi:predicted RNase H-like HicB family nuclease